MSDICMVRDRATPPGGGWADCEFLGMLGLRSACASPPVPSLCGGVGSSEVKEKYRKVGNFEM